MLPTIEKCHQQNVLGQNFLQTWVATVIIAAVMVGVMPDGWPTQRSTAQTSQPDQDKRFIAGLAERRLFNLAEGYCREQLAREDLPLAHRAVIVAQHCRVLTLRAMHLDPRARPAVWSKSQKVAETFIRQHQDHPSALIVRLQLALGLLARGELAREEAQVAVGTSDPLKEAKKHLMRAATLLSQLRTDTVATIRKVDRNTTPVANSINTTELLSLKHNIGFQTARARSSLAQCYSVGSVDRNDGLTQAIAILDPLSVSSVEEDLLWRIKTDRITCLRLIGRWREAKAESKKMLGDSPPPTLVTRIVTERVLLALAERKLDSAMAELSRIPADLVNSAEVDHVRLQIVLARFRQAAGDQETDKAARLQSDAARQVEFIASRHGPYWTRRAKLLLALTVETLPGGKNIKAMASAAEIYFQGGQLNKSAQTYEKAYRIARDGGDKQQAFGLGLSAASIFRSLEQHQDAMRMFHEISTESPRLKQAPAAHLMAIWHLARAKGTQDSDYEKWLKNHLSEWPRSPTADQARCWLGRYYRANKKWASAVAKYTEVAASSRHFPEAATGAIICFDQLLRGEKTANKTTAKTAIAAVKYCRESIRIRIKDGKKLAAIDRDVALAGAEFSLRYFPPERFSEAASAAAELLEPVIGSEGATKAWVSAASCTLAFAHLELGQHEKSMALIGQLKSANTADLYLLARRLSGRINIAKRDEKKENVRGRALLSVVAILKSPHLDSPKRKLTAAQRRSIGQFKAEGLAASGNWKKGVAQFRSLVAANDRDGRLQERYANFLADGGDSAAALEQWRRVVRRSTTGKSRWFRAKYGVAQAHRALGDKDQARRVIRVIEALYPKFGGSEMKSKFQSLLKTL